MVQQILDKSFDVLVLDFGITKRVYCDVSMHCAYLYAALLLYQVYSFNVQYDV